jgi:hypothetical protein
MITWRILILSVLCLGIAMVLFIKAGAWLARWQQRRRPNLKRGGTGTVDAGVFGLMGLLLAFTFSGASDRFERRRILISDEANTIGTAYLRLDLLPEEARPQLQNDFRRYVRSRLAVYQAIPDESGVKKAIRKSKSIQSEIWTQAVAAVKGNSDPATKSLVISSLNEMIDITTPRTIALHAHPPLVIFVMLGVSAVVSSLLAGYSMTLGGRLSAVHATVFIVLVVVSAYIILDYEYPRIGLIRLDPVDQVLIEVLESMK